MVASEWRRRIDEVWYGVRKIVRREKKVGRQENKAQRNTIGDEEGEIEPA